MLFGAGGLVVGALHAAAGAISDPESSTYMPQLCEEYVHLRDEPLLLELLAEINADFCGTDPVAAARTIQEFEELLPVYRQLLTPSRSPTVDDHVNALVHSGRIRNSLQRFITKFEIVGEDPRRVIRAQGHIKKIEDRLATIMGTIAMATRDVHIRP